MSIRGRLLIPFIAALLIGGTHSCQSAPLLFTHSGAGAVGMIAGRNVTEVDAVGGNLASVSAWDMLLGFMNTNVNFWSSNSSFDTGIIDFSNALLAKLQNCDGRGGGGPSACYVDSESSLGNTTILGGTASDPADVAAADAEMAAVSSAWAAVSGTNISLSNGGTIYATNGVLRTVTISPRGASSFTETGYVFTITNNGLNPSQNIVINGDGSHLVILNYTSSQAFNLSKNITLTGGITSDQVLINITDGSTTTLNQILQISGTPTIDADLIVTSGSVKLDGATINGRIYLDGDGVSTMDLGFNLKAPCDAPADEQTGSATPEPAAMILVGAGLVALSYISRRNRLRRGA